jgi:hypothetical protein
MTMTLLRNGKPITILDLDPKRYWARHPKSTEREPGKAKHNAKELAMNRENAERIMDRAAAWLPGQGWVQGSQLADAIGESVQRLSWAVRVVTRPGITVDHQRDRRTGRLRLFVKAEA